MNFKISFLLTSIAGFSTMLGCLILLINTKHHNKIITFGLSFASSVMFLISILDLMPEGIEFINNYFNKIPSIIICLITITIGVIISSIFNKLIPENNNLYKIGIISMIAIILHNIPEGIATFMTTSNNIKLGLKLTIAIAIHNIPEGISIALPIFYSTKNKKKAILYTLISALSEPFGALIAYLFLTPIINNLFLGILFSFIAGIMIYISTYELFPTAIKYKYYKIIFISILFGTIIVILNLIMFNSFIINIKHPYSICL